MRGRGEHNYALARQKQQQDNGELSNRAKQHAEQFNRLVGYSTTLAQRLRPLPNSGYNRPIRDFSLYKQTVLPGADAEQHLHQEALSDDHLCVKDRPDVFRDVLCFTVPCDMLEPNAATFAGFNIQDRVACCHSHALSFFFHALYSVTQLDRCDVNVYIEAVVRDPLALPIVYGEGKTHTMQQYRAMDDKKIASDRIAATARTNLVGYRIWVLLMANCYGVEVMLRRALFRCQALVYSGMLSTVEYKLRYCIIPLLHDRLQAIRDDAEAEVDAQESKKAAGGRKRAKTRGRDADRRHLLGQDDDDDEDGGEPVVVAADVSEERERKIKTQMWKIEEQVRYPVPQASRSSARSYSGDVGSQFISINSMETYLEYFVAPLLALAGCQQLQSFAGYTDVQHNIAGSWGEARRLDGLDHPLGTALGARHLLSFDRSILTLASRCDADQGPCGVQIESARYGLQNSELHFPIPALVWSINIQRLAPDSLMRHALPWHIERFDEQLRQLRTLVDTQSRARMQTARNVCTHAPPSMSRLFTERMLSTRKRSSAMISTVDVAVIRAREDFNMREIQEMQADPVTPVTPSQAGEMQQPLNVEQSASRDEMHALLRELSDILGGDDPLQLSMQERDTRTTTENIVGDITQLCDEFYSSWVETTRLVEQLERPEWVQPCEDKGWRAEKLRALNAMRIDDQMNKLLQTLNSGQLVSDMHRTAYRTLTLRTTLEHLVRPILSMAPHMTMMANAIIMLMTHNSFFKLQHGEIELLETSIVQVPQAATPHLENAEHRVQWGAPATAKSLGAERLRQQALPGAILQRDLVTIRAEYTAQFSSHGVQQYDEASTTYTDHRPESISRNPEHSRTKQQLSTTTREFERCMQNPETGEMRNHRVRTERVVVNDMLCNEVHFGGWSNMRPDAALVSRISYLLFAPWKPAHGAPVARPTDVLTDLRSDELKRLWSAIADRRKEEMALTIMLVLMATTHVPTSLNTMCVDVIQRAAFDDIERWAPTMVTRMRETARARQYGVTIVYSSVCHALLNSEASQLVYWAEDKDDRNTCVPVSHKFTVNDLPKIFAPHMYARVDHGLWATFRVIHIQYQFIVYLILREIAARERLFRRAWMAQAYRHSGIPLIDDTLEQRWLERGCSTAAWPEFLQYLFDQEQLMDNLVVASSNNDKLVAPTFASASPTVRAMSSLASAEGDNLSLSNVVANASMGNRSRTMDKAGNAAVSYEQQTAIIDPNWLDTGLDQFKLAAKATRYLTQRIRVEEAQVLSALDKMASTIVMSVPVLASINTKVLKEAVMPSDLRFIRDTTITQGTSVRYQEVPLISLQYNAALGRKTIRISTCALMVPPQILACLALTAFENAHTKPRDTVIITEVPHYSASCVPWQVRPRREHTLTMTSVREPGVFTQQTLARSALAKDTLSMDVSTHASSSNGAIRFDRDVEDVAFERHMRDLQQMEPLHETLEGLLQYKSIIKEADVRKIQNSYAARHPKWNPGEEMLQPTDDEVETAFKLWLQVHPARPFAMENERSELQANNKSFAPISTATAPHSCYPRSHIISDEVTHAFNRLEHFATPLPENCIAFKESQQKEQNDVEALRKALEGLEIQQNEPTLSRKALVALKTEINHRRERLQTAEINLRYVMALEELMPAKPDCPEYPEFAANEDDRKTCDDIDTAQKVLELLLCSAPWFTRYTTKLYEIPEWRPLLSAVVAAVAQRSDDWIECEPGEVVTKCPLTAYKLTPVEKAMVFNSVALVPGLISEANKRPEFSLNALRWLERSLAFDELLTDLKVLYASHESLPQSLAMCVSLLGKDDMPVSVRIQVAERQFDAAKHTFVQPYNQNNGMVVRQREDARLLLRRYEDARLRVQRLRAIYHKEERTYWKQLGVVETAWRESLQKIQEPPKPPEKPQASATQTPAVVAETPQSSSSSDTIADQSARLNAAGNAILERHLTQNALSVSIAAIAARSATLTSSRTQ